MNDQEPRNRGKDFLMGFLPSSIILGVAAIMLLTTEALDPLIWVCAGLTVAAVVSAGFQRPFIGLGIFAVLFAVPLILIGSCFAMFSGAF